MPDLNEFRAFMDACEEDADVWTDAQLAKALDTIEAEYADLKAYVEKHTPPRAKEQAVEWYLQPIGDGIGRLTRKATGIPLPGITQG